MVVVWCLWCWWCVQGTGSLWQRSGICWVSLISECPVIFQKTWQMWYRCSSAALLKIVISSRCAIAKGKSFKTPVMSSWEISKCFCECKGSLIHLYFPNGDVKAVLGIEESSNGMWWYPACRSKAKKFFAPFSVAKMSSTFGIGQINFCVILFSAW